MSYLYTAACLIRSDTDHWEDKAADDANRYGETSAMRPLCQKYATSTHSSRGKMPVAYVSKMIMLRMFWLKKRPASIPNVCLLLRFGFDSFASIKSLR